MNILLGSLRVDSQPLFPSVAEAVNNYVGGHDQSAQRIVIEAQANLANWAPPGGGGGGGSGGGIGSSSGGKSQ